MKTKIRILYVNGNIMKRGGIEAFMMNYFRHFDREKMHIDFIVHGYDKGVYDDEILTAGSKIYHVPTKSKHPIRYSQELKKIFSEGNYDIVHSHLDAMSGWVLKIAKECGIPVRIAHSHNTDHLTTNSLKRMINDFSKKEIRKYATVKFACSVAAGKWLYGSEDFIVINNAIEIERFAFDNAKRNELREKYNLDECFVIGHVGRFDYQKNQEFLIPVLKNVIEKRNNVKLVFVGTGDTQENVQQLVEQNDLTNDVLFMGSRNDVNEFYNMFDVFVLPSRFEGLGIVAIEAQTNGLHCLLSKCIPREAEISKGVSFLNINDEADWVKHLLNENGERVIWGEEAAITHGYDIKTEATKLENLYIKLVEQDGK